MNARRCLQCGRELTDETYCPDCGVLADPGSAGNPSHVHAFRYTWVFSTVVVLDLVICVLFGFSGLSGLLNPTSTLYMSSIAGYLVLMLGINGVLDLNLLHRKHQRPGLIDADHCFFKSLAGLMAIFTFISFLYFAALCIRFYRSRPRESEWGPLSDEPETHDLGPAGAAVPPLSPPLTPASPADRAPVLPLSPPPADEFPEELQAVYSAPVLIGKGSFTTVFRANRKNGTAVAVKIPAALDAATGRLFMAELQNWVKFRHPNILRITEFNVLPIPYIETELCDSSLAALTKPLSTEEAAWLLFRTCEGLKYAHDRSVIHRDLKPGNILLKNGIPKIADWGLSKVIADASTTAAAGYMARYSAPEQVANAPKDVRTDIWHLGVILYELVTGRAPFGGDTILEIASGIVTAIPPAPGTVNPAAAPLDRIITTCLQKDPARRYQTAAGLQADLARVLKENYTARLQESTGTRDMRRSAFYCGDLVLLSLLTGDLAAADRYLTDLAACAEGDARREARELAGQVRFRIEQGMDGVPEELVKKAEFLVHRVSRGFRSAGY